MTELVLPGASPGASLVGGRRGAAPVPVELRDAVAKWARGWGRTGDLVWAEIPGQAPIPQIRLSLRPDDRRLRSYQEGETTYNGAGEKVPLYTEEPVETVELVSWNDATQCWDPLPLADLGESGILEILDKGNTWSGRGEYPDLQTAVVAAIAQYGVARETTRSKLRDRSIQRLSEDRRRYLGRQRTPNDRVPQIQGQDFTSEE